MPRARVVTVAAIIIATRRSFSDSSTSEIPFDLSRLWRDTLYESAYYCRFPAKLSNTLQALDRITGFAGLTRNNPENLGNPKSCLSCCLLNLRELRMAACAHPTPD